jgi:DnaK suppressor protein
MLIKSSAARQARMTQSQRTGVGVMTEFQESEHLRARIEARLEQLRAEIAAKLGDAIDVSQTLERTDDSGDQSVADDLATGDFADARRDIEEYRAGEAALKRLEAGHWGRCVDCGQSIPAARLHAQPFAARCIECQVLAERQSGVRHTSL